MHLGVDTAICVQIETTVGRRQRIHCVAVALGEKLRARRWRGEQSYVAAFALKRLVNVTPHHRAHILVRFDDAPKFVRFGEAHAEVNALAQAGAAVPMMAVAIPAASSTGTRARATERGSLPEAIGRNRLCGCSRSAAASLISLIR